jgi:phenylacetate-CoA ligase
VDRAALPVVYASHLFYDSWLGLRPFDRYVRIVAPPAPAPGGPRLLTWAQRAYEALTQDRISVWEIDHQRAQDIWRRMEAFRPDFILGYTSTLAAIADLLERRGLKLTRRPRGVITIAETLTPERRRLIEEYFAAPITNRYGLREFGSWSAQSCAASPERFHVNTELVVCELLRQDGSEAAPGETARVVLTDLWNYARPFIRYDTGDLAAALPDPCPCGRGFPLLGSIEGRSAECLATADGKVISPAILGHYLFVYNDQARAVRCYQLVEESPGRVTLLVVPGDLWNDRSAAALRQNVAELVGPKVEVAVRSVPAIPPEPSGKRPIIKPLRLSPDAGRSVETP